MRRRAQGFTLIEIMVVITIIAALVSTVAIVVPKMQETQKRQACMGNLGQLAQVFLMQRQENPGKAMRYSGVSLWLSYRKRGNDMSIKRSEEKSLICGGDTAIQPPANDDEMQKWDNVDLDNPRDDLCSYAGRDFKNYPFSVESQDKEIVGSDRQGANGRTQHHKNVIVCAFEGGDAQFLDREALGVNTDADIVIGPEAENKMLKKVVYIVRKKPE